jgi:hypothetical protein
LNKTEQNSDFALFLIQVPTPKKKKNPYRKNPATVKFSNNLIVAVKLNSRNLSAAEKYLSSGRNIFLPG